MRQSVIVGSVHKGRDAVVDILLDRVVYRTLAAWRACAVVVNTQTTATVNKVNVVAHLVQLYIEH